MQTLDRGKHVYRSYDFEEIIKDTIRFFNGTPVHELPPSEKFHGTGVYAIYSITKKGIYERFHEVNRTAFNIPIYVGKAVPEGWRQARIKKESGKKSFELYKRLREHAGSIKAGEDLIPADFLCRFMILEDKESSLIGTVEAELIKKYRPIWNSCLDGFGNHDPGGGRYEQAKSDWDVLHKGRAWAEKCQGKCNHKQTLLEAVAEYMKNISA